MDLWIGKAFDKLRRSRYLDDTLVIITSDHGEAFGEHKKYAHANCLYDQVTGIPLLFWYPEHLIPAVRDDWVSLVDVMPTLMQWCRLRLSRTGYELQGRDLFSWSDRVVFSEHTSLDVERSEQFAVFNDDFKMLVFPSGRIELYDMSTDPDESADLSTVEAGMAGFLGIALDEWKEQCRDLGPEKDSVVDGTLDSTLIRELKDLGYIE